jgi:hypothetical protein
VLLVDGPKSSLVLFLCLPRCFAPFPLARSPLLGLYRASGSLGGGNGWPLKCSVTDAFNEENVRIGCQQTKHLCLWWQSRWRVKRRWTIVAKRPRFLVLKATNLVLVILIILQSNPWLKCNWILAFPCHFQASPWILIFAIWTPIITKLW